MTSSVSDRWKFTEDLRRLLRICDPRTAVSSNDCQLKADCENLKRIVAHLWSDQKKISLLSQIAIDISNDSTVRAPIKALNARLKNEGLHYLRDGAAAQYR